MAKKSNRKRAKKTASETTSSTSSTADAGPPPKHLTRHIQPLGPRVLIRIVRSPDRLESGLFLPQGAKDEAAEALMGQVLEVARTMPKTKFYEDEEWDEEDDYLGDGTLGENVSGIPLEAKVLFEKKNGVAVPWDETLRLLEVRHVLAIVEEIPEDEIQ